MADQAPETATAAAPNLTTRDVEILVGVVRSLKRDDLVVDYAKLATEIGAGTTASATTSWHLLKKKIFAELPPKVPGGDKVKTPRKPRASAGANIIKSGKTEVKSDLTVDENTSKDGESLLKTEDDHETDVTDLQSAGKIGTMGTDENDEFAVNDGGDDQKSPGPSSELDNGSTVTSKAEPNTPKKRKSNKDIQTPVTPNVANDNQDPETPQTPGPSKPLKRGRKSKAEKEAEAAAKAEVTNEDDDGEEKPAKKARKTPVKKVKDPSSVTATPRKSKAGKSKAANHGDDDKNQESESNELAASKAQKAKHLADAAEANDVLTGKKKVEITTTSNNSTPVSTNQVNATLKADEGNSTLKPTVMKEGNEVSETTVVVSAHAMDGGNDDASANDKGGDTMVVSTAD